MQITSITQVAIFSLAWFVLGLIAARYMPQVAASKPKGRSRRGSDANRQSSNVQGRRQGRNGSRADLVELYVGNLPYDMSEDDVSAVFGKYGKVVSTRLIENRSSGKSKGFGFIEMGTPSSAEAAIKGLNSTKLKGRSIVVSAAKSQSRRGRR